MIEIKGKYNKDCKIFCDDIEQEALSDIYNLLDQPISEGVPIRIMADVHSGKGGNVIGFTMPMTNMVDPNMIGVDISCTVTGAFFNSDKGFDLSKLDKEIRRSIPFGMNTHKAPIVSDFPFDEAQKKVDIFTRMYNNKYNTNYQSPTFNQKWLTKKLKDIGMNERVFWCSLGSIGGGNHFCELSINENGQYLLMIHCGSRNFGLKLANYHSNQAKKQVNLSQEDYSKKLDNIIQNTPDKKDIPQLIQSLKDELNVGINRNYLQGDYMFEYLCDVVFASVYAHLNHTLILEEIRKILKVKKFDSVVETIHNYIDFSNDDFMIRKGAISAKKDEIVLIPISMKFGTLVCKAKGNDDFNQSLNHGAGRIMSRSKIKELVSLEQVQESMKGIYCQLNNNVIDESCFAYKKPDYIIESIKPNADIIGIYSPILNLKDVGGGESWKEKKLAKKKRDMDRQETRELKWKNKNPNEEM